MLLYEEIKKTFKNRFVWGLILVGLIFNTIIFIQKNASPTDINGYSDVYQEIKGEITNEKVQYVIKKYKMLKPVFDEGTYSTQYDSRYYSGYFAGDYNIFEELYQKLKRDTTYNYKSRSISCFYDWYGWDGLFSYDYSTLFGVIIAIAICIFAVFKDKTGEMEKLIRTTHIGWKKVIRIKLIACILASYFCAILFSVMDITCFGLRYGLEGWNLPLYYVDGFRYTWFNGTVLEYLTLWMMLRGLGIIIFAMVTFIVGEIIREQIIACGVAIAVFFIAIPCCLYTAVDISPIRLFVNYNYLKMMNGAAFARLIAEQLLLIVVLMVIRVVSTYKGERVYDWNGNK